MIRHPDRHRSRRPSRHRSSRPGPDAGARRWRRACRGSRAPSRSAFLFEGEDDLLIGARRGAPLAVGYGEGEKCISARTRWRSRLHRHHHLSRRRRLGDPAARLGGIPRRGRSRGRSRRSSRRQASAFLVDKGNYRHFMAKEIHEQPEVVARTLAHYIDFAAGCVRLPFELPFDAGKPDRHHHHRLRHRLLCRHGRQILVRALRPPAGRDRCRLGIPLSRGALAGAGADDRGLAIGRDGGYAGGLRYRQGPGPERSSAWSMCRPRPSRAKAISPRRRWPGRKSASPRPRPSPAS